MKSTTTDQTGLSLTMQAIAELEACQGRRCETVQQLMQELLEDDVPDQTSSHTELPANSRKTSRISNKNPIKAR